MKNQPSPSGHIAALIVLIITMVAMNTILYWTASDPAQHPHPTQQEGNSQKIHGP